MSRSSNTTEFVSKSKLLHHDKYDYSAVEYTKSSIKVKIVCPEHGEFQQTPNHHLRGHRCPKCGNSTKGVSKKQDSFIEEAKNTHNNNYLYDKVVYKNNNTKVIITCPTHGDFEQAPKNHLKGQGCPECGKVTNRKPTNYYRNRFINLANEIFNKKYDYSIIDYRKSNIKVSILCPEHGVFRMLPNSHLSGQGCPACSISGFDKTKPAILYYLKINGGQAYKIGITNRTIGERFSNTELQVIEVLKTWYYIKGYEASEEEQRILKEYKEYKYTGDNLLTSGNTELFCKDILNLD